MKLNLSDNCPWKRDTESHVMRAEGEPMMIAQADLYWQLFETSGCIAYYLLYKMLLTQ
jgi:hypothetical protein